jgi:phospholipid/cholesterol/gamma-HCH transport system ATP-binding protein
MSNSVVCFNSTYVAFGNLNVHQDINLNITSGESVVLLGPSGTGKTVLLKLIVALLKPTKGSVSVFGENLNNLSPDHLSELRRRVGMLFQGAALFDSLSVFENVAYPLRARGLNDDKKIKEKVSEKLSLVGLLPKIDSWPAELSGGQKKRVGLARALVSEPELMLFDEPTTGLDPTSIRRIDNQIVQLNQELGITTISVTHDIGSASRIASRWVLLSEGTVKADGPPNVLVEESPLLNEFVTGNWQGEV